MGRYKLLYETLLGNQELKRWFPKMSGEWEKDKEVFIKEQEKLELTLGIDVHTTDERED